MAKYDKTTDQIKADIQKELRKTGNIALARLRQPTAKWNHKPVFKTKMYMRGDDLVYDVTTDDAPYFFVDGGTSERWRS